jgi:hypothetical protein
MRVNDKYRTNPLSHQPGGHEVTVVYSSGKIFEYDKVKKPGFYVKSISEKNGSEWGHITEIKVDGSSVWRSTTHKTNPWDI